MYIKFQAKINVELDTKEQNMEKENQQSYPDYLLILYSHRIRMFSDLTQLNSILCLIKQELNYLQPSINVSLECACIGCAIYI